MNSYNYQPKFEDIVLRNDKLYNPKISFSWNKENREKLHNHIVELRAIASGRNQFILPKEE